MQNRKPSACTESLEDGTHSKLPECSEKPLKTFGSRVNCLSLLFPSYNEFLPQVYLFPQEWSWQSPVLCVMSTCIPTIIYQGLKKTPPKNNTHTHQQRKKKKRGKGFLFDQSHAVSTFQFLLQVIQADVHFKTVVLPWLSSLLFQVFAVFDLNEVSYFLF